MKRLVIICEGQTENEFCKDILGDELRGYFNSLDYPLIKHSGGGIVEWKRLRDQILRHLSETTDTFVTTFIDYYGIEDKHNFPGWQEAKSINDKYERIKFIEEAMKHDIPENVSYRFIPYIQLHEFETLLFSNIKVFKDNYEEESVDFRRLEGIVQEFPNPEDINCGKKTAPSKRIENAVSDYNKVIDGNSLAMDIGIKTIRSKCPHFNAWINQIENIN